MCSSYTKSVFLCSWAEDSSTLLWSFTVRRLSSIYVLTFLELIARFWWNLVGVDSHGPLLVLLIFDPIQDWQKNVLEESLLQQTPYIVPDGFSDKPIAKKWSTSTWKEV